LVGKTLLESDLNTDPLLEFEKWYHYAQKSGVVEPSAMLLATADSKGVVSARAVLLKEYSEEGFSFVTNYESRKGKALLENPKAALTFLWTSLDRQIRIEGEISKWDAERSDRYFKTRPRGSQIGAHASKQSSVLKNRAELEQRFKALEAKYAGKDIPRPENWGGFILKPQRIEFWQGRENRLSDRILYLPSPKRGWETQRLSP